MSIQGRLTIHGLVVVLSRKPLVKVDVLPARPVGGGLILASNKSTFS